MGFGQFVVIKSNDPCPVGWRVPTLDDTKTLLDTDKVNRTWTTVNNVNGEKFTDKTTGNSIFLPAAGYRESYDGTLTYVGSGVYYWGSSNSVYYLRSLSGSVVLLTCDRRYGHSVRCVAE